MPDVDENRRLFLKSTLRVVGGCSLIGACYPFLSALKPTQRTLAAAGPVRVDLSSLKPGEQLTVSWQNKPIWIIHRTQAMLAALTQNHAELCDPTSQVDQQPPYAQNEFRSVDPRYLVLVGICTHLGCVPKYHAKSVPSQKGSGFLCPCHGSRFDMAGRVYQSSPAPINLEVPPYRFINAHTIEIGIPL